MEDTSNFFEDIDAAIGGYGDAFNFLFGWIGGRGGDSYTGGGAFATGGYSSWSFGGFVGGG